MASPEADEASTSTAGLLEKLRITLPLAEVNSDPAVRVIPVASILPLAVCTVILPVISLMRILPDALLKLIFISSGTVMIHLEYPELEPVIFSFSCNRSSY